MGDGDVFDWHADRGRLLAEAHARPATPLIAPVTVIRLANVSGQDGVASDRAHMAALCRSAHQPEPDDAARWWAVEGDGWSMRWERHTEFSSWTLSVPLGGGLKVLPRQWRDGLPGDMLVATRLDMRRERDAPMPPFASDGVMIGSRVFDGTAQVFTDLRPDEAGFTRFRVLLGSDDPGMAGRLALVLLEIETYRLMALLAFPLAGKAAEAMRAIEAEAGELAARLSSDEGAEIDRALLARLIELSGETEALSAQTTFRFGGARAYYELVRDRIASLGEAKIAGLQTIGEFMDRRLAPAMRTCDTVAAREREAIARIARAGAMLDTRIKVADEATNAALLSSMNQRADASLRLQRTVEGLSVAAISYYSIALLAYPIKALEHAIAGFDATIALAIAAPIVALSVWRVLRRIRRSIEHH